ncbi:uncharacterized protein LOC107643314 isoform X2 [Arachis ipaensis]|uniref:uncharacterized protein LOC107643314 isoform X2 n=1 Tax=Arachis ipaensis TaxID=130454 RepID=UPI000A2B8046|nr:uncharacterized protein LOC107643314 isoform X2 [Arachis ipaensis]
MAAVASSEQQQQHHQEKRIEDELSYPIMVAERVRAAADEADSFKTECSDVWKQVDRLLQMLRSLVRFATSAASSPGGLPLYERPVRRVASEASKNLDRALSLVRKCKRRSILRRVVTIVSAADFRKVLSYLEASIGDMRWLLSILDADGSAAAAGGGGGIVLSLPPIASNDPILSWVLADSPMKVQIRVAQLVARMAEHDPVAQEDFARENAIRPLVTLLSFDTFVDDPMGQLGRQSIHSIVQINREFGKKTAMMGRSGNRPLTNSFSSFSHSEGSSRGGNHRKDRENEDPAVKLQLKVSCAEALWMLARGSVTNSRKITETKGMLCLAKLVEKEQGELQYNCLMTIMEITAAAESNADLRRAAFKTNSPAAKAVVEQLLRIIKEVDNPSLRIPAIKSIGSLARTFPARETRVIGPLVAQLSHKNTDVAAEAAIALNKFACPDNFLHVEHSKAIIEFNGVPALMRLLRANEITQLHGLILLCYLALHAGNSESLEQARVLTALEGADRAVIAQHPELRELVSRALIHLSLYHAGMNSQRITYLP